MKALIYIITILTALSCTQHDIMHGKNILIKEFPQEIRLTGEKIDIASIGVIGLHVIDTFLICHKANGVDNFLDVYDTQTLRPLGKFLHVGRGPSEFLNAIYEEQYFKDSLNTCMWISDGSLMKSALFNLTESIRQQKTILDSCIDLPKDCIGNHFILGDTLISIANSPVGHTLSTYDLKKDIPLQQPIVMFRFPFNNCTYALNMGNRLHPDHEKFASIMIYFNQINIFSPQFTDVTTLSIYEPTVPIKEISFTPERERIWYFSDLRVSNSHIYALYINNPSPYLHKFNKRVEIQQFDWKGTPIRKFIISNSLISFTLDMNQKCIYGNTINDEIYKYDIQNYCNQ